MHWRLTARNARCQKSVNEGRPFTVVAVNIAVKLSPSHCVYMTTMRNWILASQDYGKMLSSDGSHMAGQPKVDDNPHGLLDLFTEGTD